jgi:hypothetical protein
VVRGYGKQKSWPLSGKGILETEVLATSVARGYWKQRSWPLRGKRILEALLTTVNVYWKKVLATQWQKDTGNGSPGHSVVRGYWKQKSWPLSGKRVLETEVPATQW